MTNPFSRAKHRQRFLFRKRVTVWTLRLRESYAAAAITA